MIGAIEFVVCVFLLVRATCVLNQTTWRTHKGIIVAHYLLGVGTFALLLMRGQGLEPELFSFYVFGVYGERVLNVWLLAAVSLILWLDRRRERPCARREGS